MEQLTDTEQYKENPYSTKQNRLVYSMNARRITGHPDENSRLSRLK